MKGTFYIYTIIIYLKIILTSIYGRFIFHMMNHIFLIITWLVSELTYHGVIAYVLILPGPTLEMLTFMSIVVIPEQ